jgi:hypothetical protein
VRAKNQQPTTRNRAGRRKATEEVTPRAVHANLLTPARPVRRWER